MSGADRVRLSTSQQAMVAQTLRVSVADAGRLGGAPVPGDEPARDPHPAWPPPGTLAREELVVGPDDTAASMGHPDPAVQVLGSPRLALWFELVASRMLSLPEPLTHVGVGIVVHHLDRADVGERVVVEATLESVSGRRAAFTCRARCGDQLVGFGTHQRVLLER